MIQNISKHANAKSNSPDENTIPPPACHVTCFGRTFQIFWPPRRYHDVSTKWGLSRRLITLPGGELNLAKRIMAFRKSLLKLSNKLTDQNLDHLKFLCILTDAVPVCRMEGVQRGTDLFTALHHRGKISPNDLGFLVRMFHAIGRMEALEVMDNLPELPPPENYFQMLFAECLVKLVQSLSAQEVSELVFQWADSILNVSSDQVFSATQLFQLLLQRQHLTPVNVKTLYDGLGEIGRRDLCVVLDEYLDTAKLQQNRGK